MAPAAVAIPEPPPPPPRPDPARADRVLVLKSERIMHLLYEGEPFRTYKVALGIQPVGHKMQQGDNRTPEGEYVLGRRNPGSRFHKSIHISYPNAEDRASARARGVDPGDLIMIHGVPPEIGDLGADHRLWDWTNGCIAVTNQEMDEIWDLVGPGTPIEIRP
ncbi:MAG: murein L,D-transpeptidase family protein [Alphaproteobacteria bacterium]